MSFPINESVEARIREINDALQLLRNIVAKDFDELTIYERLSARYLIIQLVEAAASVCVRVLLRVYNETAEGYPECFMRLGLKGVLPEDLASKLASVARLRNLLVQRSWTTVDRKVYESAKKSLKDFEEFVTHVRGFLQSGGNARVERIKIA